MGVPHIWKLLAINLYRPLKRMEDLRMRSHITVEYLMAWAEEERAHACAQPAGFCPSMTSSGTDCCCCAHGKRSVRQIHDPPNPSTFLKLQDW